MSETLEQIAAAVVRKIYEAPWKAHERVAEALLAAQASGRAGAEARINEGQKERDDLEDELSKIINVATRRGEEAVKAETKLVEAQSRIMALEVEREAAWRRTFEHRQHVCQFKQGFCVDCGSAEGSFSEYELIAHGMCHRAGCQCQLPLLGWTEHNTPRCRLCNTEVGSAEGRAAWQQTDRNLLIAVGKSLTALIDSDALDAAIKAALPSPPAVEPEP